MVGILQLHADTQNAPPSTVGVPKKNTPWTIKAYRVCLSVYETPKTVFYVDEEWSRGAEAPWDHH